MLTSLLVFQTRSNVEAVACIRPTFGKLRVLAVTVHGSTPAHLCAAVSLRSQLLCSSLGAHHGSALSAETPLLHGGHSVMPTVKKGMEAETSGCVGGREPHLTPAVFGTAVVPPSLWCSWALGMRRG